MLELTLYDVVPASTNARGEMGRVVVPPPEDTRDDMGCRKTGKFFVCCRRIFLTTHSLELHRRNGCKNIAVKANANNVQSLAEIIGQVCSVNKEKSIDISNGQKKYSCTVEDAASFIDTHQEPKTGEIFFTCRKCLIKSPNLRKLTKHVKQVHAEILEQRIEIIQGDGAELVDESDDDLTKPCPLYKCDMCSIYKTTYKSGIVIHKQKAHVLNGGYQCAYCTCCYGTQEGLTLHLHRVHNNCISRDGLRNYKKDTSPTKDANRVSNSRDILSPVIKKTTQRVKASFETFKTENMTENMKYVTSISTGSTNDRSDTHCHLCTFTAKDAPDLGFHLRTAHVIFGVECECGCSFATATELTNHKNNQCPKQSDASVTTCIDNVKKEPCADEKKHSCDCGKTFGNARRLTKHKELCDFEPLDENVVHENTTGNIFVSKASPVVKASNDTNKIMCPHCKKYFKNEMGLRTHTFQMHSKAMRSYDRCEICKCRTYNYRTYKLHKRASHVVNGIKCPVDGCLCSFKSIEGVTQHCRMNHKQKLDRSRLELKCEHCDFIAFTATELEKHSLMGHVQQAAGKAKLLHTCELCNYETSLQSTLEKHIQKNHVENGIKCDFCNNTFSSILGLRSHSIKIHKKANATDDYSVCKLCGYRTQTEKNFKDHFKRCHSGPHKCLECVCSFRNLEGMIKHMLIVHKKHVDKTAYLLKCRHSDCKYTTYFSGNLRHHETIKHVGTDSARQSESGSRKIVQCPLCNASTSNLDDHLSRAHVEGGFPCQENCTCSFKTKIGLYRHMKLKHGKTTILKKDREYRDPLEFPVNCQKCSFRCKNLDALNRHSRLMHGFVVPIVKQDRICPICNAKITGTLLSHKKRYHVQNGFKCLQEACPCSFETNHSRVVHMKKAHQLVIKKRCQICNLKLIESMSDHMKRCHFENGLKCEFKSCPCTFETETGMRTHLRIQHSQQSPIKNKKCHLCGLAILETLEKHIKRCHVKNGLPCSLCNCSFETEQGRTQHLSRRHNVVVSTNCTLCGVKPVNSMNEHLKRCHVSNGLPCTFCSCSFKTEQGLAHHMRYRHQITVSRNCTLCGIKPVVSMNAHLKQSHVVGGLPCSYCSCSFETETSKIRHLARYHNVIIKPSSKKCSLCNKVVSITMEKHHRIHHVSNGYDCTRCGWSLPSRAGLSMHMLKIHHEKMANETPVKTPRSLNHCNICGFGVYESLQQHMERNHSSANQFKCNFCPSKFTTILGRSRHVQSRHKKAASMNAKSRTFQGLSTMKIKVNSALHPKDKTADEIATCMANNSQVEANSSGCKLIKPNPPNSCTDLELGNIKIESNEIQMERHASKSPQLSHEAELTCPQCGYIAKHKSHLNMHMQKSHVKTTPFSCKVCPCTYSSDIELMRHILVSHTIKEEPQ